MKLVAEILDASDLMPKDGQGSASPFVEVDFDGQRMRTATRERDLNPVWNERLEFNVTDPDALQSQTIVVDVYNDRRSGAPGHHKNFLGRVKISGSSVPRAADAAPQRFPLDKRGLFSHIRGEIALNLYIDEGSAAVPKPPPAAPVPPAAAPEELEQKAEKKKKKDKEKAMEFSDLPPPAAEAKAAAEVHKQTSSKGKPHVEHKKPEQARVEQIFSMHAHPPAQPPPIVVAPHPASLHQLQRKEAEFGLVETSPPLGGVVGYYNRRDKTASTYDLVEQLEFLYVSVVKAKDLPAMDVSGSCDPYVEVKLGNYKGTTKHHEKTLNPVWNQVFAFSKERLQASVLEITVKDKDLVKDDFVGKVVFDLCEIPVRVPPDSPLAPQWYRLEDKKGESKVKGEIMLAVWRGTQADEAYPEAWHSDAVSVPPGAIHHTKSKVYFSPKLCYVRVCVIEAQDLVPGGEKGRMPDAWVKVQLGQQLRRTRPSPSQMRTVNPLWNEELLFVAADPFEEHLVISVDDRIGGNKEETIGRLILPLSMVPRRNDNKMVDAKWYNLEKPSVATPEGTNGEKKKEVKFASRIHLRVCLDGGYHVLDESTYYSSDLRPTARQLWKQSIGVLEVGILGARNLLPLKTKNGRGSIDAYCVAKYGQKWVRTRTLIDSLCPSWNEQYTWEVYDPCTVITICVFDNSQLGDAKDAKDQRIGKVRIRLSTLETDRVYTHYYPLLVLHPSGLKKTGELHLAVRFTCSSFINMMHMYSQPLLPKMHYVNPISVMHLDLLRHHAIQIVAARLGRAEPPLRKEAVDFMLDIDQHMFSLRRSKANFYRIMSLFHGVFAVGKWFNDIRNWTNPVTTVLVHVLFLILVCYPELILPTVFLYLFLIGLWNYRFRPRKPPHMDTKLSQAERAHPDELDEEFDTFPTSRPPDIVRMRYDRLRNVAGRVQTVVGDLATQGERLQGILSWRDPRATTIFVVLCLCMAVFLYVTPFQVVAVLAGLYFLRHPRFRSKLPSVPVNFFRRLPAQTDRLL
ncbi:FT-interacting protein 7-like [Nymphaea colorata]|uniref:C2 domain-containing protein n=1 Tax=Nymphaea colorata TaxID=210225 RepID=A0A5K0VK19_9MAGN|nr:FT-interacting protein 7-like [Nymphaea colorata]